VDGSTGGSGRAKLISPLGDTKRTDGVGYDLAEFYHRRGRELDVMAATVPPRAEVIFVGDARLVVVAYGTVGKYVRQAVYDLRTEGLPVGFIRPITLFPFPTQIIRDAAAHADGFAVYENNRGQMVEDVQLAVLGRADVRSIGGLSMDSSGFGIAPDLDVATVRTRIRTALEALA
jgi:2-oxoglutarate/2-oxoacid ferredoxin oxidoreductase subunit alpha